MWNVNICCLIYTAHNTIVLGVVHNCHHFHERIQRTLGGGGQGLLYAFLNVVYSDVNKEIIAQAGLKIHLFGKVYLSKN